MRPNEHYGRARRRALRHMPGRFGTSATRKILRSVKRAVRDGSITELDAVELLEPLAKGNFAGLSDHPVYQDGGDNKFIVLPDGTKDEYREPGTAERKRAVSAVGHQALAAHEAEVKAHPLRTLAEFIASTLVQADDDREIRQTLLPTSPPPQPTGLRDLRVLIAAARPGPSAGVMLAAA